MIRIHVRDHGPVVRACIACSRTRSHGRGRAVPAREMIGGGRGRPDVLTSADVRGEQMEHELPPQGHADGSCVQLTAETETQPCPRR